MKRVIFGAVSVWALASAAVAHSGATGVVKERMDRFEASKDSAKVLRGAVKSADFAAIEAEAVALNAWASEMLEYFPEGSGGSPSEALDTVWSDWDGFSAKAGDYEMATAKLVSAAQSQDAAATASAFKAVMGSCKGCHDDYKAD